MNILLLLAGMLSLVGAVAHGLGGETMILSKVSADAFPTMPNGDGAQAKAETRMTWHGITVYFTLNGGLLLLMAFDAIDDVTVLANLTAVYLLAMAVLLLIVPAYTLKDWRASLRSPQWVLLLLMAGLTYAGSLAA